MPASRLSDREVAINRHDVVGEDASHTGFVKHVALAVNQQTVQFGTAIDVNHMGPPLERGKVCVHTHGTAELNDDELNQIELFVTEHLNEAVAQRQRTGGKNYGECVILPHVQSDCEMDGTERSKRYSCAGYVVEAYREAAISLVAGDENTFLPEVELNTLYKTYPELEQLDNNPQLCERIGVPSRQKLGLQGNGPWPVLLPGYILHALGREADDIRREPYKPQAGDEYFPRQ